MEREPPARRLMPEPTALPCSIFLDAPNEVTAPDFGLFRDTLNSHFYPARVQALDRHAVMREPWLTAVHLTLTTIGYVRFGTHGQRRSRRPAGVSRQRGAERNG